MWEQTATRRVKGRTPCCRSSRTEDKESPSDGFKVKKLANFFIVLCVTWLFELFFLQVEFMVRIFVRVFLLVQKVPVGVNEGVSPQVCVSLVFLFH